VNGRDGGPPPPPLLLLTGRDIGTAVDVDDDDGDDDDDDDDDDFAASFNCLRRRRRKKYVAAVWSCRLFETDSNTAFGLYPNNTMCRNTSSFTFMLSFTSIVLFTATRACFVFWKKLPTDAGAPGQVRKEEKKGEERRNEE
jgi:hypothetical protein